MSKLECSHVHDASLMFAFLVNFSRCSWSSTKVYTSLHIFATT